MRAYSHIEKAFCLGNILPDIQPSFVTKRHEYFGTFDEVQGKISRLVENGLVEYNDRVFWRRAGEIMHYIADYFTFPHNKTFDGSLRQHNTYEKHLKNELKVFVESGRADIYAEKNLRFDTLNQLLDYIRERHNVYLDRKRSIEEDIHYILSVCFSGIPGIVPALPPCSSIRCTGSKYLKNMKKNMKNLPQIRRSVTLRRLILKNSMLK